MGWPVYESLAEAARTSLLDRTQSTIFIPLESMLSRQSTNNRTASTNSVSMDEDELAEVVSAHVEHVFSCVHRHHGIILKSNRDSVTALFFGESSAKALKCAVEATAPPAEYSDWYPNQEPPSSSRAAIHTDTFSLTVVGDSRRLEVVFLSENGLAVEYLCQVASIYGCRVVATSKVLTEVQGW